MTSKDYGKNIKARDFAEIVQAVCTLHKTFPEEKIYQREMTLIAQRTCIVMGKMNQLSREIVYAAFSSANYNDPDLKTTFKKYNLIKGFLYRAITT